MRRQESWHDPWPVPHVPGVLTSAEVHATACSIVAVQEPDGAIPWTPEEHADVWNHVEAVMALLACGLREPAERGLDWVVHSQRADGSWPLKTVAGEVEDATGDTNMSAYFAVGVWHHWLLCRDRAAVRRYWPVVRAGLDFVCGLQLPYGGIAWAQEWVGGRPGRVHREGLLAGSSSIYQSLRAGVALAELVGEPQPHWEMAGGRLGHALRHHRDLFLDKSAYSMDWYYPVLGGAVRGAAGRELIAARWDHFVRPGLGIVCVDTNPWVTGAETCELAMAMDALGDPRAVDLLAWMQHLRHEDGSYWTGWVYGDDLHWPVEQTTYTSAAVVLAADEISRATPGGGIMRGDTLADHFDELAIECGCASADVLAGQS